MEAKPSEDSLPATGSETKSYRIFLLLSFVLGLGLTVFSRLFNLTKYGLWQDEVFSLRVAKLDWTSLFQAVIHDAVHPPLFYILLKVWIAAGGESLLWVKCLPLLFGVASIGPLYFLCRNLSIRFGEFCLALLFVSLNAYSVFYAQELRMYSMLAFFSLLSMALFAKYLKDGPVSKQLYLILFLVNLLLVFTHYFGWFTVIAECAVTFVYGKPKLKSFLAQILAVGLCFLPWCILVGSAAIDKGGLASNMGWVDKPGITDIPLIIAEFNGRMSIAHGALLSFPIFLPPLLVWLWQIYKNRTREDSLIYLFLGLVTALPVLFAYSASHILASSIWVDRYMAAAAIPYILLAAVSVSRMQSPAVRRVFIVLMLCWSLGVGFWDLRSHPTRVNWVGYANRILDRESILGRSQNIFVLEGWTGIPLQQQLDANGTRQLTVQKVASIEQIGEREFWLAYRQSAWKEGQSPTEKIRQMGCTVEEDNTDPVDFDSVHLLQISCNR